MGRGKRRTPRPVISPVFARDRRRRGPGQGPFAQRTQGGAALAEIVPVPRSRREPTGAPHRTAWEDFLPRRDAELTSKQYRLLVQQIERERANRLLQAKRADAKGREFQAAQLRRQAEKDNDDLMAMRAGPDFPWGLLFDRVGQTAASLAGAAR